jgi:hypothetical protein
MGAVVIGGIVGPSALAGSESPDAPSLLEAVQVSGRPVPGENKMMGPYHQPEWTARRRFVLTSVYVQPEGQCEVEVGYDYASHTDGPATRILHQEIEIGLPRRFQLNLENTYQNFRDEIAREKDWHEDGMAAVLRYAFADWGKLPLNPAASVGWKIKSGAADTAEFQLALADELSPNWHWGAALFYERQVGGLDFREHAIGSGISYSVLNEKINLGAEAKYSRAVNESGLSHTQRRLAVGPSVQWRPSDRTHLDFVPMWGVTSSAPKLEVFVFFGFEFGDGSDDGDDKPKVEPASLRSR